MPPLYLLIKPASANCNLGCGYCFYRDVAACRSQASFGCMDAQTQEAVIRKALEFADGECTFAYQGGEPTLAGIDYFLRAEELQRQYNRKNVRIQTTIQTNGWRLGEEWARFFAEHHCLVGVSLDGIAETHNAFRKDPEGNGTFNEVMKTIRLLKRHQVPYNILTVVNRRTARHIDRIYTFYRANDLRYVQFIPCLDPLEEEPGGREYSLSAVQYGEFLKTLFDLWYRDWKRGDALSIRQFDNYAQMLLGIPPESCGMAGVCSLQYVVEADGSVYPCDFYATDAFRLGDLRTEGFVELDRRRREIGFVEESQVLDPACRDCSYFPLCRGGCRRNREPKCGGNLRRNVFCEAYRTFFPYAADRLWEAARFLAGHL